jgi:hypothetical protein
VGSRIGDLRGLRVQRRRRWRPHLLLLSALVFALVDGGGSAFFAARRDFPKQRAAARATTVRRHARIEAARRECEKCIVASRRTHPASWGASLWAASQEHARGRCHARGRRAPKARGRRHRTRDRSRNAREWAGRPTTAGVCTKPHSLQAKSVLNGHPCSRQPPPLRWSPRPAPPPGRHRQHRRRFGSTPTTCAC